MGADSPDTSGQDAEIKEQEQERSDKLASLEQQRFSIIKSEGAPIWNSLQTEPQTVIK